MDKTTYEVQAQVETMTVLPRTLVIMPEQMGLGVDVDATMHVVYGLDAAARKQSGQSLPPKRAVAPACGGTDSHPRRWASITCVTALISARWVNAWG